MKINIQYILLIVILLFFTGCDNKSSDDVKIGFIAGLSGKYSSLGTSVRDGFLLAFDEIDYKIDKKNVTIIQKDDKQDSKFAYKAMEELLDKDINLIVGNATSSMTKISLKMINKYQDKLLISATASGDEFSHKDDNFLRIQVENSEKKYKTLLEYIQKKQYKNIFLIYDSKNSSYTQGYKDIFQEMIVKNGGDKFIGIIDINSNYEKIIEKLKKTKNDMILIVGNSIDTANIIQYIRYKQIQTEIMASGWAKTMDFITNGGRAVEGVVFSTGYDDNSKNKKFTQFVDKFQKKYEKRPSVFAAQGYELAQILIENLKVSTDISTLKNRILEKAKYEGLQGDIIFNKYGDISREYFIMKVINKSFEKMN